MATVPQPSEILTRALEQFRDAMKPVVIGILEQVWGARWDREVERRMTFTEYNPLDLSDVKTLLNVMDFCWRDVFALPYGPDARAGFNKVKNLELVRNRWAHFRGLTINESYRAVDDMLQLMVAFGVEQREEMELLRDQLLYRLVDERSSRKESGRRESGSRGRGDNATAGFKEALADASLLAERFRIEGVLGRPGGFGITYLASDIQLERSVAIKEYFPPGVARGTDGVHVVPERPDRFERGRGAFLEEARALAAIDHPAIMPVLSFFEENGTAYIEMPFRAARSLEEELELGGPMPPDEGVALMLQLLDGLEAVHGAGLLHLDIKPSNILVDEEGRPILIDFGAARRRDPEHGRTVVVSPGYAAPEQYSGESLGQWTDVYACGATLYSTITGLTPPAAPVRQAGAGLDRADRVDPAIPLRIGRGIESAMGLDRRARPSGAKEFAARLRVDADVAGPPRRRLLAWTAGLVLLLAVAAGIVHFRGKGEEGAGPGDAGQAGVRVEEATPAEKVISDAIVSQGGAVSSVPPTVPPAPRMTSAEALEQGRRALQEQRYEESAAWFLRADSLGAADAAYNLGIVYSRHLGRVDDAERWYRRAAEAGDDEAQTLLGFLYESELGRPVEAERWYERAVDQGNNVARVNLARLYAGQDRCEEAFRLASVSVDEGAPEALFLMGVLTESGCGVEASQDEAAAWFERAAADGHMGAFRALVRLGKRE